MRDGWGFGLRGALEGRVINGDLLEEAFGPFAFFERFQDDFGALPADENFLPFKPELLGEPDGLGSAVEE